MNDQQIDYFMAVATNLSFTKTSEELYVSQPAISKQIALLEKELGAKLFRRNNQRTELTAVGRLYYDLFSRYKADLINTKIEAAMLLNDKQHVMRVGFLEGWDLFNIIPPMMEQYKERYPDSEVVINCCGIKELSTLLLTDGLDIAVAMTNTLSGIRELSSREVARIRKILMFSAGHRLAGKEGLTPKDFQDDTFFAPWEIVDKAIIEAVASYTRPYGFVPKLRFVQNHESMITCVRNNMGVAIVDDWVWAKNSADLCWIPMKSADTISVIKLGGIKNEAVDVMEEILASVIRNNEEASNRDSL